MDDTVVTSFIPGCTRRQRWSSWDRRGRQELVRFYHIDTHPRIHGNMATCTQIHIHVSMETWSRAHRYTSPCTWKHGPVHIITQPSACGYTAMWIIRYMSACTWIHGQRFLAVSTSAARWLCGVNKTAESWHGGVFDDMLRRASLTQNLTS